MRKLIFIAFMVMSVCGYAQKYEVGTTTAVWKAPAAADFLHAKAIGVKYGTQKWSLQLDGPIGAFPALSADGVLYCLTNKSTLYALDVANGAIKWQQSLDGTTGSAVAIDRNGHIYAGT